MFYAAGKIAVKAGLLKWPTSLPLSAAQTLFRRARELQRTGASQLQLALKTVADAVDDPKR